MLMTGRLVVALLLAFASPFVVANDRDPSDLIDSAVLSDGFLDAHPDLQYRLEGMKAYKQGDYKAAFLHFLRAAHYADKPSQGMIADMYWAGIGVAADRELGYAWMDLAAERQYPQFVLFRERYWEALDEVRRAAAIKRGHAVFAAYRDVVAKPRLERELRRGRSQVTGSRTGFSGTGIWIQINTGPGTGLLLRGDEYYAKKYWDPERYWQLQDKIWRAPKRGQVHVGEPEQAKNDD